MSNSTWIDYEEQKPPNGSTAIAYLEDEHLGSKLVTYRSVKTTNGFMVIIDGVFHFDFSGKILCWKPADDLLEDLPLKYT